MSMLKSSLKIAQYALLAQHANLVSRGVKLSLVNTPIGISYCESDGTQLSTVAPQTWLTGTRVRLVANAGTLPPITPLTTSDNYWLIRLSNSTFRLASSYSNAVGFIYLTLPVFVGGFFQLQVIPVGEWLQNSLTAIEMARWDVMHPSFPSRFTLTPILDLPPITYSSGLAQLKIANTTIVNGSGNSLTFNALCLWEAGSTSPGDNTVGSPICLSAIESVVSGVVIPGSIEVIPTASRSISYSLPGRYDE